MQEQVMAKVDWMAGNCRVKLIFKSHEKLLFLIQNKFGE
jgi:hypothetical protein